MSVVTIKYTQYDRAFADKPFQPFRIHPLSSSCSESVTMTEPVSAPRQYTLRREGYIYFFFLSSGNMAQISCRVSPPPSPIPLDAREEHRYSHASSPALVACIPCRTKKIRCIGTSPSTGSTCVYVFFLLDSCVKLKTSQFMLHQRYGVLVPFFCSFDTRSRESACEWI